MDSVTRLQFAVYRYDSVCYPGGEATPMARYRPREGELLFIKNSPQFGDYPALVHGHGGKTVGELLEFYGGHASAGELLRLMESIYRSAEAQDAIDAGLAPLHSPKFTGVPEVPVPDYTVELQAVPVRELREIMAVMDDLLYGKRRILERGAGPKTFYRKMERGVRLRKIERAVF
jgi:hypothetical protein